MSQEMPVNNFEWVSTVTFGTMEQQLNFADGGIAILPLGIFDH